MITRYLNKLLGARAIKAGPPPADAPRAKCPGCGVVGIVRHVRGMGYVIEGCRCGAPSEGRE